MCYKFVLSVLLTLSNIVINKVIHIRSIILTYNKFLSIDNSVVSDHKDVIISDDNS